MAHIEQQLFCLGARDRFPQYFRGVRVLDCGSLDINGSNRGLFENSHYTGIDVGLGPNVDTVCKTHEFTAPDGAYDTIISTECFEHDQFWPKSLANISRMLKSGGFLLFTCATEGRPEHGTRRSKPEDSPLTVQHGDWGDYYRNLTEADMVAVWPVASLFAAYEFVVNSTAHDIYFWGIKR